MKYYLLLPAFLLAASLAAQDFTAGGDPAFNLLSPVVADFNGDTFPDVLGTQNVSGHRLVLQLNQGITPLAFTEKNIPLTAFYTGQPAAGDFDGDGDIDLVVSVNASIGAEPIHLLRNDGAANFTVVPLNLTFAHILIAGDVDNDGDADFVGFDNVNSYLYLYTNNGNASFTQTSLATGSPAIYAVALGDIDNDEDLDIIAASQAANEKFIVYQNNGGTNFQMTPIPASGPGLLTKIVPGDFNGDGKLDILAIELASAWLLTQMPDGTFDLTNVQNGQFRSAAAGDFNGDSRLDFVLGKQSGDITWHENLPGTGVSFLTHTVGPLSPALFVVPADLDLDGDADIVASDGKFRYFINNVPQMPSGTIETAGIRIAVTPNPFVDAILLQSAPGTSYTVDIFDVKGRSVFQSATPMDRIELPGLNPGFYCLRVRDMVTGKTGSTLIVKKP